MCGIYLYHPTITEQGRLNLGSIACSNCVLLCLPYYYYGQPTTTDTLAAVFYTMLLFTDDASMCIEVDFVPFTDLTNFAIYNELDGSKPDSHSDSIYIPDGLLFGNEFVTVAYVRIFIATVTVSSLYFEIPGQ